MTPQTIAELLAATARLEELPLGTVRELLALRPQARELADRLDALEQNVGGLLAAKLTTVEVMVQEVPVAEPIRAVVMVDDDVEERWTLRAERVEVGIIAYFDTDTLNTDEKVTKPRWLVNRVAQKASRPCVCVAADGETCTWIALSNQFRDSYQKMKPDWIHNGSDPSARLGTGWLTSNYYAGPVRSFCIAAAQTEHDSMRYKRPRLSPAGLKAVLAFAQQSGLNI